jgi:dTMP kinase
MMATPTTGLLVVIEGIDGAGKTTLRAGLAAALRSEGHEVVETKEPTDGPLGQEIRRLARVGRDTVTPEAELELFLRDRAQHVAELVLPALARHAVVLQDRSYYSTVAYQGGPRPAGRRAGGALAGRGAPAAPAAGAGFCRRRCRRRGSRGVAWPPTTSRSSAS